MSRRVVAAVLLVVARAAAGQAPPTKMSVSGDSLTQAALADGITPSDQWWNSWAFGITSVNSVWSRYRATLNPTMAVEPVSQDGAKMMRDFYGQASQICGQATRPNRVFVFLGQNDACYSPRSWTWDAAANMPKAAEFQAALHNGLDLLDACLPDGSVVHVVSVVRVDFLYEAGIAENAFYCRWVAWPTFHICPIITREPYASRRRAIGRRIDEWNAAIAAEMGVMNGRTPHRVTYVTDWQGSIDQGQRNTSVGSYVFGSPDINGLDCFHASVTGQRKIACVEWAKSLDGAPLFQGTAQSCLQ
jgi:hypothetical protein